MQLESNENRRRAKIKLLAKKSIETGEDCDAIPDSMRQYLALQATESGKPFVGDFLGRSNGMNPYGGGGMIMSAESNNPGKVGKKRASGNCNGSSNWHVVIHHFTCKSLSIGTWRRVGQNAMDLVIFYAPDKACLTYYINNDSAGYKIEFPFSYIKNITLENVELMTDPHGISSRPQGLLVELHRPPNFFMESSGSGGFTQCGDFTEEQQASQVMIHHLGGHPKVLSGQLAKLVSLNSFQNRHNQFDHHSLSMPPPMAPPVPRPASQPNHMSHPHLAMFQENPFGMNLHPGPRGHKRTRSRSVPVAVDFSMLQSPMPSFHIQQPSTTITDASIYAPVPQHHNNLGHLNPNLRINTSPSYDLDFRYPMSAATTTSPSDYASPPFYTSATNMDPIPAASFNTPYGLPFLSPMMEHPNLIHPSISPLSALSHGDPVIAGHSPPLSNMHRSPSAEFLTLSQDHGSSISDDSLLLSEMYSKQNLNLPMHSPSVEELGMVIQMHEDSPGEDMDLHNMVSFASLDSSSLSPENHGM